MNQPDGIRRHRVIPGEASLHAHAVQAGKVAESIQALGAQQGCDDWAPAKRQDYFLAYLYARSQIDPQRPLYWTSEAAGNGLGWAFDFAQGNLVALPATLPLSVLPVRSVQSQSDLTRDESAPVEGFDPTQGVDELVSSYFSESDRRLLLNLLWHHPSRHSPAGQTIRKLLGIGRRAPLTPAQVDAARAVENILLASEEKITPREREMVGMMRHMIACLRDVHLPDRVSKLPAQAYVFLCRLGLVEDPSVRAGE